MAAVSSEPLVLNISIWLARWALHHPSVLSLMKSVNMLAPPSLGIHFKGQACKRATGL